MGKRVFALLLVMAVALTLALPGHAAIFKAKTYSKGDRGDEVKKLQERLISLGYLDGRADGVYGDRTAAAVRDFCRVNGLPVSGDLSPKAFSMLNSKDAKRYQEPYVPLTIEYSSTGQWRNASGGERGFRFQVTNKSRTHTVKAFEIYYYTENVWGDRIDSGVYTYTDSHRVAPGKTLYTDYVSLPKRSQISKACAGIHKVIFTDGTVRENTSVSYSSWIIK